MTARRRRSLQFNDFGLVAITRKRVKQSLERTLGAPCPYCESTGYVKSVTTVCNEIYVEMRKIAKHLEHEDVMLRVHPDVAKELKGNNGRLLNEMEELTKRTIIVKSDPACTSSSSTSTEAISYQLSARIKDGRKSPVLNCFILRNVGREMSGPASRSSG
jgi:Ribonuclease G/E